jgi:hypothetical protein
VEGNKNCGCEEKKMEVWMRNEMVNKWNYESIGKKK